MEKERIKYFTKRDLIQANDAAIRENRNRQLKKDFLKQLPDNGLYPITFVWYHTKDEIRVRILFDNEGNSGFLDMSQYRYELIPTATIGNDGTFQLEAPELTASKRPYSNGREWQESVVRKPVRKQSKFRREVLKAYGRQCAVCSINNPSLLRAAHIIPVVEDNDDTINNGICLCILHEVAFDKGILKISPEGEVFICGDEDIKIDMNQIRLPIKKEDYPSVEKLRQRYERN
jgi:Predicted restriction endonuclease